MKKIIMQKEIAIDENTTCWEMSCDDCPFKHSILTENLSMDVKFIDIIKEIKRLSKIVDNFQIEEVENE